MKSQKMLPTRVFSFSSNIPHIVLIAVLLRYPCSCKPTILVDMCSSVIVPHLYFSSARNDKSCSYQPDRISRRHRLFLSISLGNFNLLLVSKLKVYCKNANGKISILILVIYGDAFILTFGELAYATH